MRWIFIVVAAIIGVGTVLPDALAEDITLYYSRDGLAIQGYDPVEYFKSEQAVPGVAELEAEWSGVTWRFVSAANRDAFVEDPIAFAPQYNGYCAFAASRGIIYQTDPNAWSIYDGKLYLNASLTTSIRWRLSREENIRKADQHWPQLSALLRSPVTRQ